MRVVSWNVNGIRPRLPRLLAFLQRHDPDVLCLQETKVTDREFPLESFAFSGHHIARFGQASYNGVAFISKTKPEDIERGFVGDPTDHARVIAATIGGIRVVNVYVVNGKDPLDPAFAVKMEWLTALRAHLCSWREAHPDMPMLVLGDFNVAPEDIDVYDPEGWRGSIHCTAEERAHLAAFHAQGFHDLHRHVTDEQVFTWWDYRGLGFPQNKGLRIDLALGTEDLVGRVADVWVDRDERKDSSGDGKPSDHAPLVVDLG